MKDLDDDDGLNGIAQVQWTSWDRESCAKALESPPPIYLPPRKERARTEKFSPLTVHHYPFLKHIDCSELTPDWLLAILTNNGTHQKSDKMPVKALPMSLSSTGSWILCSETNQRVKLYNSTSRKHARLLPN